jgi:magnesium transporter
MLTDGSRTAAPPELLYLLHGDPSELAEALTGMRAADVADALRELGPEAGAKVMAALPFDLAVQVFDEPELDRHRAGIISCMAPEAAAALAEAMSADQRADLVRELKETDRLKLLKLLEAPTRQSLEMLLEYPPESAGGIMTTEFVSIPATWTVEQALRYIGEVGRAKETVYAVYVLDPQDQRLARQSLRLSAISANRLACVHSSIARRLLA